MNCENMIYQTIICVSAIFYRNLNNWPYNTLLTLEIEKKVHVVFNMMVIASDFNNSSSD